MTDRPILFSAPMVQAILDGTKTQTRRVAKLTGAGHVKEVGGHRRWHPADPNATTACPYGQPSDRLWVRETWAAHWMYDDVPPSAARSDRCDLQRTDNRWFAADGDGAPSQHGLGPDGVRGRWRPSIHMPRWASRITLEITGVRLERLKAISEADAKAEGAPWLFCGPTADDGSHMAGFAHLWEQINGAESWASNPLVWVVEFKPVV